MELIKFLFGEGKLDKTIAKWVLFAAILMLIITAIVQEDSFSPPGSVTSTHRYGTPLPESGRTVWYFDYHNEKYYYLDEKPTYGKETSQSAGHQPRGGRNSTLEERIIIRKLTDDPSDRRLMIKLLDGRERYEQEEV